MRFKQKGNILLFILCGKGSNIYHNYLNKIPSTVTALSMSNTSDFKVFLANFKEFCDRVGNFKLWFGRKSAKMNWAAKKNIVGFSLKPN